jgi:hypothetical protein
VQGSKWRSLTPVKLEVPPPPATAPAAPAAAASAPLSKQDRAALQAQLSLFTAQVTALEGLEDEDAEGEDEDDPDADGELELDRREEEEEEEEEDTVPTLGAAWASQAWRAHGYVHAPDVQMAAPHVAVREEEEEEEEEEMQFISDVACAIAS